MPRSSYRRRDTLTGGTKDVNPQFMNLVVTQTGNDVFTYAQFPIPVQRLGRAGRAQVMEVLKIFWESSEINRVLNAQNLYVINGYLCTQRPTATTSFIDGITFAEYVKSANVDSGVAGSPLEFGKEIEPCIQDLTDGAGHGYLIATDHIYISCASFQTAKPNSALCKILYRWKDVSVEEYVGIVQSQQ